MTQQQKQSVNPLLALAVILFYGALLVVWLSARDQATSAPAPAQLAAMPDGSVLVGFQQHLYRVNAAGSVGAGISIPGLSDSVGMAARDNDTVFVYEGGKKREGFTANLRAFMRAERPTDHPEATEGVYLCQLDDGNCTSFSYQFVVTGSARLLWDAPRQHLIVSDTGQHDVLALDENGQLIRTLKGFEYPNGIWQQADTLLVADTNHHRIASVNLNDLSAPTTAEKINSDTASRFGCDSVTLDPIASLLSVACPLLYHDYVWPTGVARIGNEYWVLVADDSLSHGRLYRYSTDWKPIGRGAQPLGDLVNLAPLGKGALVVDFDSRSLWQLDAQGKPIHEVWLPGLKQVQADQTFWRYTSWGLLALLIVSFAAGFVYALRDEHKRRQSTKAEQPLAEPEPISAVQKPAPTLRPTPLPTPAIETWIEHGQMVRYRHWILALCIVGLLSPVYLVMSFKHVPVQLKLQFSLMMIATALFLFCLMRLFNYVGRSGLGTRGSLVLLRTPDGNVVVGKGAQIRYSGYYLVIDEVIMPLGNWRLGQESMWKRKQLKELLVPALRDAQEMSTWEAFVLPWQLRFWPLLSITLAGLFLLVVMGLFALN